jgi:(R,R)-butanediol dehydrogenase/meso-butanediol dehydrogenase/diacetyl reductase
VAALAEPLGVALHVIARLRPRPGAPILIAGAGPVGGLSALLLAEQGLGPLHLVERNEARRDLVCRLTGATAVELEAGALRAVVGGDGPAFAVEATGSAAVLATLPRLVAPGARIAMVGIFHGPMVLEPNLIVERELVLIGCSVFAEEQAEAVALLPRLAPRLAELVSPPITLDEVPAAYERLLRGQASALKTIIRP